MTLYIANCKANKEPLMGRAGRGGEAVERSRDEAVGRRRRDRHAGQLLPRRCCVLTQRSTRPKPVAVARPAPLWLWHCHCLCLCLCVVGLLRGNWGKSIKISQESPSRRNVANIKSDKQTNKQTHRHTVTARQGTATTRGDLGISQVGRKRRRPHGPGVAGRNRFSRKLGQAEAMLEAEEAGREGRQRCKLRRRRRQSASRRARNARIFGHPFEAGAGTGLLGSSCSRSNGYARPGSARATTTTTTTEMMMMMRPPLRRSKIASQTVVAAASLFSCCLFCAGHW